MLFRSEVDQLRLRDVHGRWIGKERGTEKVELRIAGGWVRDKVSSCLGLRAAMWGAREQLRAGAQLDAGRAIGCHSTAGDCMASVTNRSSRDGTALEWRGGGALDSRPLAYSSSASNPTTSTSRRTRTQSPVSSSQRSLRNTCARSDSRTWCVSPRDRKSVV